MNDNYSSYYCNVRMSGYTVCASVSPDLLTIIMGCVHHVASQSTRHPLTDWVSQKNWKRTSKLKTFISCYRTPDPKRFLKGF